MNRILSRPLALSAALKRERRLLFTLEFVNEQPAASSSLAAALRAIGFSRVPKGLSWYG
jgi:ATP-dependent helicase Lhr and Lhr-like helicase